MRKRPGKIYLTGKIRSRCLRDQKSLLRTRFDAWLWKTLSDTCSLVWQTLLHWSNFVKMSSTRLRWRLKMLRYLPLLLANDQEDFRTEMVERRIAMRSKGSILRHKICIGRSLILASTLHHQSTFPRVVEYVSSYMWIAYLIAGKLPADSPALRLG